MAMIGMDVDQVESIGNQLKHQADAIVQVIAAVDGLISQAQASWQGNDATQFIDWWNSQHKPNLHNASESVRGLGQSAINNASEQRSVSGH